MSNHKCDSFCAEYGCEQMKKYQSDGNKQKMSSFGAGINDKEPMPKKTNGQPIWEMVIEDMKERDLVGENRYGTKLQKFNGRNSAKDAYQEILDFTVYTRQWIEERKEMADVLKEVINSNAPMEMSDELYWKIENILKKLGEL